jgi:hypothetical protein
MDEALIVTINDIRKTGHCVRGIRQWFSLHNLDFADFLNHGISASDLIATGDQLAADVIDKIKGQRSDG